MTPNTPKKNRCMCIPGSITKMFIGTLFVRIPEQKQPNIHKYYDKDIIAYSGNTIVLE